MGTMQVGRRRRPSALAMAAACLVLVIGWPTETAASAAPAWTAVGSVEQVYATGLPPAAEVALLGSGGQTVATRSATSRGGVLFREVAPGTGYRVRTTSDGLTSGPITVRSTAPVPWNPGVYDQPVPSSGYSYLTTRDGTKLAIDVHLPTSPAGLGVPGLPRAHASLSDADRVLGLRVRRSCGPAERHPPVANLMGFAVVDVNMRGTGCSGGPSTSSSRSRRSTATTSSRRSPASRGWRNGKVGMMGISYGGISQLFVARPARRTWRRSRRCR